MTKDLAIIIVSWRVKDLLKECLESIYHFTRDLSFEVIVVDNDSGDGTVEMVGQNFPQAKLIASRVNLGFARANNLGLRQASARHYLLLNPDTRLTDNILVPLVKYLDKHPQTGVLGAQLLNYNKTIQPSVRHFPSWTDHLLMMFKLHHFWPLKKYLALDFDYARTGEVDQVMGAFFAISGPTLKQVGYLDEKYYIWFEEVDYCQRVKRAGLKVVYWPEISLIHYGGQSFKQVFSFKKQWIFSKSRLRYIFKYQNIFVYLIILLLTPVSLLLSLIFFGYEN
jgi:hypothetical protein